MKPNAGLSAGDFFRRVTDAGSPMGSWLNQFGIKQPYAAPLSGALLGAGTGLLYHGVKNKFIPWLFDEPEPEDASASKSTALGTIAGLGLGGLAAYGLHKQKVGSVLYKQQSLSYDPSKDVGRLAMIILNDRSMPEMAKQNALVQLQRASEQTIRNLLKASAGGAITGAILASMLGVHPAIGAFGGGAFGSAIGRNFFSL